MDGEAEPHRFYEDALAMVLGTLFVALGMLIYAMRFEMRGSLAASSSRAARRTRRPPG